MHGTASHDGSCLACPTPRNCLAAQSHAHHRELRWSVRAAPRLSSTACDAVRAPTTASLLHATGSFDAQGGGSAWNRVCAQHNKGRKHRCSPICCHICT